MKWFAALVCLLFLSIIPASADSLVGPAYNVTGSVVFTGNNACGGVCMETVDFSFTFQWVNTTGLFGPGIYGSYVPGSFSATQFGTMGSTPITSGNDGHIFCCGPGTYIPMQAFNGELDLDVSLFGASPDPGLPIVGDAFLYTCGGACFNAFGPRVGASEGYATNYTVTAAPEPGVMQLLGAAMLCVVVGSSRLRGRKHQPRES